MQRIKKLLIACLLIFCSYQTYAQKYPTLDDMFDLALLNDTSVFRTEILQKGFHHLHTVIMNDAGDFYIEFADNINEANGTVNKYAWIAGNGKHGASKYVSFATTNIDAFTELMHKMDERGFKFIKNETMNDDKGGPILIAFYRFSYIGIMSTINQISTKTGVAKLYSFAVRIPAMSYWPDDR